MGMCFHCFSFVVFFLHLNTPKQELLLGCVLYMGGYGTCGTHPTALGSDACRKDFSARPIRGFHVGDARLGGVRIFDARVKIQHDAQWSALTRASIF